MWTRCYIKVLSGDIEVTKYCTMNKNIAIPIPGPSANENFRTFTKFSKSFYQPLKSEQVELEDNPPRYLVQFLIVACMTLTLLLFIVYVNTDITMIDEQPAGEIVFENSSICFKHSSSYFKPQSIYAATTETKFNLFPDKRSQRCWSNYLAKSATMDQPNRVPTDKGYPKDGPGFDPSRRPYFANDNTDSGNRQVAFRN